MASEHAARRAVMFSGDHAATDDYAKSGQDVESPLKTVAQEVNVQPKCPAGKPLVVLGEIQVGMSGLKGAQYAVVPADAKPPHDDPYLQKLPWQDGVLIPPPADFAAKIPGGPKGVFGLDPASGAPITWPIPAFIAFWGAVIRGLKPGHYKIYARAINRNGDAQPCRAPSIVPG